MTCSNWMITLLSLAVIVLTLWPRFIGASASMWVTAVAALLIILLVWSGCNCKWCACSVNTKKKKK